MSETFYNEWAIHVDQNNALYSQRFVISRSASSDGSYAASLGMSPVTVSGEEWTLAMEWNDNNSSGWQASRIRRSAEYTVQGGFTIVLAADDGPAPGDQDFDDLVLICKSLDPTTDPPLPTSNPYDFTISEEVLVKREG